MRAKLLDKIQIEGTMPSLDKVINLMKNLESRQIQSKEMNYDDENKEINKISKTTDTMYMQN